MDEDIVVEQRMVRADQLAVAFTHLDVRRGKELEECLPPPHAAIELRLQGAGRIPLIVSMSGHRENQHIPTDGMAVLFGPKLLR